MNFNADLGSLQCPAEAEAYPLPRKKHRSPSYLRRQEKRKRVRTSNSHCDIILPDETTTTERIGLA